MLKFLVLLIYLSSVSFASSLNVDELWKDQQWLNLLRYKSSLLGGYESEADGDSFFIAKDGKTNPKEELLATIKNINEKNYCRFPARYSFLKTKLGLKKNFKCKAFEDFKKKLSTKSVSLVFSSYYINTPASAFGHTLFRFSKFSNPHSKTAQESELLDYAVNYAASVTTNNALLYGVLGIVGGFRGEFATMPYFYKVREYNDFESRDLWSYHLDLDQKQIDFLLAHLWEMKQTWFNYFYFTENCSYHLLGMLDAVNPKWNLTSRLPSIVIPVDTLRVVNETKDFVKSVDFRPSKKRVLSKRLKDLNGTQTNYFSKALKNDYKPQFEKDFNKESKAKVYDTLMDYIDFKYSKEVLNEESTISLKKRKVLIQRAKLGISSVPLKVDVDQKNSPDKGHKSRRFSFGGGSASHRGNFLSLNYRYALHDLMDRPYGHNPNSTMEMGNLGLRYYHKIDYKNNSSALRPNHFYLINVNSFNPLERFFNNLSWRFLAGAKYLRDDICSDCFSPTIEAGGGVSRKFSDFQFNLLLTSFFNAHKDIERRGYRLGFGPELAIFWSPADYFRFKFFSDLYYSVFVNNRMSYRFGSSAHIDIRKNLALSVDYNRFETEGELSAQFYWYF